MNPAALKTNLKSVKAGGIVIVNEDAFGRRRPEESRLRRQPAGGRHARAATASIQVPINKLTAAAAKDSGLGAKDIDRCKNMFALGLVYWLYDRPLEPTLDYIRSKFCQEAAGRWRPTATCSRPATTSARPPSCSPSTTRSPRPSSPAGTYRKITGNEATALGMIAAARLAGKQLLYCSYPITPASDILHQLVGPQEVRRHHLPGRGRDRRRRGGHRRQLRRRARRHRHQRPRHRPQGRGDRAWPS